VNNFLKTKEFNKALRRGTGLIDYLNCKVMSGPMHQRFEKETDGNYGLP